MFKGFIRSIALLAWAALLGCTQVASVGVDAGKRQPEGAAAALALPRSSSPARRAGGIAASRDTGELFAYSGAHAQRREAALVWHPVQISEAHALNAIRTRTLQLTTPDGEALRFGYARHVEHPSGDWTWVGRLRKHGKPVEAIITFGQHAVFGVIDQSEGPPLRIRSRHGATWIVAADRARPADFVDGSSVSSQPDYLLPPRAADGALPSAGSSALAPWSAAAPSPQNASVAATVIDVLLGYSAGFAAATGGPSQAVTRLNNMVEVANQAYLNSQVDMRVRLVHAMQVEYTDINTNENALRDLTGTDGKGNPVPIPASLQALRAARDQYGADVVSLVRKFQTPEQGGCGIAWLLGGGNRGEIRASEQSFAYSIVGDGTDPGDDGKTYFCREETLAHEIGHTLGSQHDRATATDGTTGAVSFGVFPYSFGYKTTAASGDFYTVMAYSDKRESPPYQRSYRVFSNPRITYCGGFACGVAEQADNARSLSNTSATVSRFRASIVPDVSARPDLFAISKLGGSGFTEMHVLSGATYYTSFKLQTATILGQTGTSSVWQFALGDLNRDGVPDLYSIYRQGSSGRTELYVLDGAQNYRASLLQVATALRSTGNGLEWAFVAGDYNRDGVTDLYVIYRTGLSGMTEVHVLDGATHFQSYLAHIATALGQTGNNNVWKFGLADRNGDGVLDLYCINRAGVQRTEVHVLDGARAFQVPLVQTETILPPTGAGNEWDFKIGDYNLDGVPDLYAIYRTGVSGRTELYVLDGAANFNQSAGNIVTALPATGAERSWEFELWRRN
jgi:peptidyl-Asp metalloendopeptidase